LLCSYRLARGSYRQLYDVVYPELLRIGRNQQRYQQEQEQEQEQERRRQQLQHALEALEASNSEIKSLQNKVRKSAEFRLRSIILLYR
jgi:stress response protein YsnF